jgi:hypothetical protein
LLTLALLGWGDDRTVSLVCGEQVDVEKLAAKVPLLTISEKGVVRAHDLWTDSVERLYTADQIASLLPAVREALRARHDALRLVTVAELLRDSDTIRMAALDLVRQTMASLPVQQARIEDQVLQVVSELVTATLAELNGDLDTALEALSRLPTPHGNHPMREPAAWLYVYMLVLAGRADEAVSIADGVLLSSTNAHVRTTPPFVRWSAGDVSEIDELRADDGPAPDINARDRFFYATLSMYVRTSTGDIGRLRELAELLETVPVNLADARDASILAAAVANRLIAEHEEACARRELAEHLRRYPVDDPRCDVQLRRALAAVYVCVPDIRPAWDDARLGRCHRRMHAVARAILAAREAGSGPVSEAAAAEIAAALEETAALITMLLLPLSVELAVRAHGLGMALGIRAIELLRRRIGDNVLTELRWQREHGDDPVQRAAAQLLASADVRRVQRPAVEVLSGHTEHPRRHRVDTSAPVPP